MARKSSRDFPKNLETQRINKTPQTWCIPVSAKWHFSPALRKVDGNLPWLLSVTKGGWLKNSAKMKDGI
jgi:hypothetical protein